MTYIISQIIGWIATIFRAGGMLIGEHWQAPTYLERFGGGTL